MNQRGDLLWYLSSWTWTCMMLSKESATTCPKTEWSITCISFSSQLTICIETASFIEISNQKIFFSAKIMLSWPILDRAEESTQNSHTPSISLQGGTEHLNAFSLMVTTDTRWICGEWAVSFSRSYLSFHFSQEMMRWIKFTRFTIFLDRQIKH